MSGMELLIWRNDHRAIWRLMYCSLKRVPVTMFGARGCERGLSCTDVPNCPMLVP
ncbi:hypothetical protein [Moraxella lacunata]|uniref:hypothetical protein n=1 Tax=Moraxella lacunata TaxID=477 RepID=UPI003EE2AE2C